VRVKVVIPFVAHKLQPGVGAVGELIGARFERMERETSYWDLVAELWTWEGDFIVLEEDVLQTEELINETSACG
jgi:hypothetical protein